MSGITNTCNLPTAVKFATALPGGIEAQEARGQRELVASNELPADMGERGRELFVALGGVIEGPVDGDPLFVRVRLPPGWTKAPTDHPLWSELRDACQRRRAMVFYKAASYDRRADMEFVTRYSTRWRRGDGATPHAVDCVEVRDYSLSQAGVVVHRTRELPSLADGRGSERLRVLDQEAEAWMDAHLPGWRDPIRAWDIDVEVAPLAEVTT